MFVKQCYWKDVEINAEQISDESTEREKLDKALLVMAVKTCKDFGLTAEATVERLKGDPKVIKTIYACDELGLLNWD